jgi:glutathione synthase/RimK-type ligase-like ATP-grasp enzyme
MHLALATRADLPAWEVDDRHLHRALAARGVTCAQPVWDDPTVDWARFDAVLIRTTWDYQEKLAAFRRWSQGVAAVTRLDNPPAVVQWNTHKHYLRDLQARGTPLAPTHWLPRGSRADVAALVADLACAEGFLKPCVGSTARETLRFRADAAGLAAAQAHVERLLPHEDLMLQPFLPAVTERGEWSAVFVAGCITHCVRKIPVAGDYRVQDDFGARDEPYAPTAAERAAAEQALAAARQQLGGLDLLYARADFLWDQRGDCVLTELELVEPSLFFRHCPAAAAALADAWLARLRA